MKLSDTLWVGACAGAFLLAAGGPSLGRDGGHPRRGD